MISEIKAILKDFGIGILCSMVFIIPMLVHVAMYGGQYVP